jgi:hypothetical protein
MSAEEKKSQQDEQMITRRRLLLTLGVTAGTVAASVMIPGKWIKPIVDVGVLPAHAQLSPGVTCTTTFSNPNVAIGVPCGAVAGGTSYTISIDYLSVNGIGSYSATVNLPSSAITSTGPIVDPFTGSLTLDICLVPSLPAFTFTVIVTQLNGATCTVDIPGAAPGGP